jgi:glycerol-3-phosphate acyltransferase PlsY
MTPHVPLAVLGGYLIGSLSTARLVVRLVAPGARAREGTTLRLEGSDRTMTLGTVSATSVSLQVGPRYGFLTYVVDLLKIALPMLVVRALFPDRALHLVCGAAGMVGHVWPVWHRFRGGRGISVAYGGLLVIDPLGVLATSLAGMLLGLVVLRDVLAAYMGGVLLILPWVWWRTGDPAAIAWAVVVNLVFVAAMVPEIRQWARIRREEKWNDPVEVMQLSGMLRGILRMGMALGVVKQRPLRAPRPAVEQEPPAG